jgi:hypothetical protein
MEPDLSDEELGRRLEKMAETASPGPVTEDRRQQALQLLADMLKAGRMKAPTVGMPQGRSGPKV